MMNTHNIRLDFGKHKDELLTRVPVSYIRWMINNLDNSRRYVDPKYTNQIKVQAGWNDSIKSVKDKYVPLWLDLAKAELERRGDTLPKVEISAHAIDKASLRVMHHFDLYNREMSRASRKLIKPVGLYSWLSHVTLKALEEGEFKNDKYHYMGMKLVIEVNNEFPTLKTIMV